MVFKDHYGIALVIVLSLLSFALSSTLTEQLRVTHITSTVVELCIEIFNFVELVDTTLCDECDRCYTCVVLGCCKDTRS